MELSQVRRIILAAGTGSSRAPMAAGTLSDLIGAADPVVRIAR